MQARWLRSSQCPPLLAAALPRPAVFVAIRSAASMSALAVRSGAVATAAAGRRGLSSSSSGSSSARSGASSSSFRLLAPAPIALLHRHRAPLRGAGAGGSTAAAALARAISGGGGGSSKAPPPARWTPTWVWVNVKEAALHYWHGSKLLYADIRIASKLLKRIIFGRSLSRREHKLLVRAARCRPCMQQAPTTAPPPPTRSPQVRVSADIARLVPLLFFVIVPLAEFALPFAIRLFPNLLPSTFEEKHHAEEKQKKMLKVR